jgi:membrane-associated protein
MDTLNIADLFDAHAIVTTLGLVGILSIIFAETGLLVGLFFPGDSLLFIAGIAASSSAVEILGTKIPTLPLLVLAPIVAIIGSQVGYWFGAKFGRKYFDRPDGRFFNQKKVQTTEKWLNKYGVGKALILARYVPFVRTLINPMAGIINVPPKKFFLYNCIGAIIWTQSVIGLGIFLGDKISGSVDAYLLPIIGGIILLSLIPVIIEVLKELNTRRNLS